MAENSSFNGANADLRGLVYVSEVHWAGSLSAPDDDFIEMFNGTADDLDIGGWAVEVCGQNYALVSVPPGTRVRRGGFFTVGNNTSGALLRLDTVSPELRLNASGFKITVLDGSGVPVDRLDFNYAPAGSDRNGVRRSMLRATNRYGALDGSSPYSWKTYSNCQGTSNVRDGYAFSYLASPGQ